MLAQNVMVIPARCGPTELPPCHHQVPAGWDHPLELQPPTSLGLAAGLARSRSGSNSAWAVVVLNRSAGLAMPVY